MANVFFWNTILKYNIPTGVLFQGNTKLSVGFQVLQNTDAKIVYRKYLVVNIDSGIIWNNYT
jgi:hypothetical protein